MPPQPRKRPMDTATKNSKRLHHYAVHVDQRCPGFSTAEDILSFLDLVSSKTNAELVEPCSGSGTQLCHILDHLSVCNEFLQLADMELKEVEPGKFGVFPLEGLQAGNGDEDSCIDGWTLLHWLLQEHACIKSLMLPWTMNPKYQGLLSDALRLNSGLNKLKPRGWQHKGRFADISAIGTLAHLKELNMGHVCLSPKALGKLGKALQKIPELKTLTLPCVERGTNNVILDSCIIKFVRALRACSKIAVLSTDDFVLEPGEGDAFAEYVAESVSLRKLVLYHSVCHDEVDALFTAVEKNNNIEELHLHGFVLYEEQEQLLAKAVAHHTGLRCLEVDLSDLDCDEWENDGVAFADLVGCSTGLREMVFVGGNTGCIPAFAEAVRKNTTMEKLTLGLVGMAVSDYRVFLQALACNESLKLVTFEEYLNSHFSEVILLMQETGTEGRLEINADVIDPQDFESGLQNSASLTKVRYSAWHSSSPVPSDAFRHLLHHHHVQELSICLEHQIETESAASLALFLSTASSLRCVTLEFLANAASSRILVEGIASNKSLTSLSISFWTFKAREAELLWHMLGSSKTLKTLKLELLDLGQGQVLDQVPDSLLNNHYLLEATLQQNPVENPNVLYSGIRGHVMNHLTLVSTETFQFGVQELLRRNLSTLHRAVQFVTGSRGRRFAEAFERISNGLTLREALKRAFGESEDDIEGRIASSLRYLDEHFLAEAGVVRNTVVCGKSSRVQLDQIGFDNWLRIRRYLKVTEILLKPGGVLSGPSSSKKHC